MDLWIMAIRTIIFYFVIFIIYRIMGKREVGQLGIIDLVVSILIAELAVISIEDVSVSLWNSIIPIFTLTILQIILAYLTLNIPKFRKFLDGNPSVIIKNGKLNYKEMVKQKYNIEDLLVQIREKGYRNIEEVEYAILENNGTLSVFPSNKEKTPFPIPVILDGKIEEEALIHMHRDKNWLLRLLKDKDLKLEDIFYGFYKGKNIFVIKYNEIKEKAS